MMKKFIYIACALLLASCGNSKTASISTPDVKVTVSSAKVTAQSVLADMQRVRYRQSELLVKFKDGVSSSTTGALNQTIGSSVIKGFGNVSNLQHLKLPASITVQDAVVRYMSDPNVEYAEPNYLWDPQAAPASVIPIDPFFYPQQWALLNKGEYASGVPGADIKATQAWAITMGNPNLSIAVLDSGIDYTHPDLVENIRVNPAEIPNNGIDDDNNGYIDDWRGWNFVWDDLNGNGVCDRHPEDPLQDENCHDPLDDTGHGTHVSGIIGAPANNGIGIAGIMWRVRIIPVKVCNTDGCPSDAIVNGLGYASLMGAKVANLSFGGYAHSSAVEAALNNVNSAGMLVVASAGNDGWNNDTLPLYPASYRTFNMLSVASTDQNDRRSDFSNFGVNSVHVGAPGSYILSTMRWDGPTGMFQALCSGSGFVGYDFCSGTSMAAPQVTGLAGLLYSYYPHMNHSQVRGIIMKYVDKLATLDGWVNTGGRINAYRAVSSLLTPGNITFTDVHSTSVTLNWTDNATGEDDYVIERWDTGPITTIVVDKNATSYTDTGLADGGTYYYRVKARSSVPNPPSAVYIDAYSAPTADAGVTLHASGSSGSGHNGGGGGGCSIGSAKSRPAAVADAMVMMTPLLVIIILRGIRRRKK